MAQNTIDEIIRKKQAERASAEAAAAAAEREAARAAEAEAAKAVTCQLEEDKFYSILLGEGLQENFLELQFNDGSRSCFSYTDLLWFNYDPAEGIDLDFGGILVTIQGRGFVPRLFNSLKQKRVAWIKEADVELQDHQDNETFVQKISVLAPESPSNE